MQGGRNLALSGTSVLAISQEPDGLPLTAASQQRLTWLRFLHGHQRHLRKNLVTELQEVGSAFVGRIWTCSVP